jgi:uncharacterized metal-binding protein YceD (DUF177 family)
MKIVFDKIYQTKKPFELTIGNISLKGSLVRRDCHLVLLNGELKGSINLRCDRCAYEFEEKIELPLNLTLTDRIIETKDDLDIIEFLDGVIDIGFILQGEIISIQSSYHICAECRGDRGNFEKEF